MNPNIARAIIALKEKLNESVIEDKGSFSFKDFGPVKPRPLSYTEKYTKDQFFFPEYDFKEIQIAQHSDGYFSRAIRKKVNRLTVAGFSFISKDEERNDYLKGRLRQIAYATGIPTQTLVHSILFDLARYNNCIVVKTRSEDLSGGNVRMTLAGSRILPVAGYHILPIETLRFKAKPNGELIQVEQRMPTGNWKEFAAKDIIHFYTNKSPGFFLGTPELIPAIDDVQILRRIEENIQDLIETNLFPVYHFKVGTDQMPERMSPEGQKESDKIASKVKHMPPGGVFVTDHRHSITAIGSEGRSLRIDYYIKHFKDRLFASLGTSSIDMGEGDSANRSTASTLSKGMLLDIEALAIEFSVQFDSFIVDELLLENDYDIFEDDSKVSIQFGVIDKEEKRADENQVIQLWTNNLCTHEEARMKLNMRALEEPELERTYYALFGELAALATSAVMPNAAAEALGESPISNISAESVKKEEKRAEEKSALEKKAAVVAAKAPANPKKTATGRPTSRKNQTNSNKVRPANQYGKRSASKTTKDVEFPNKESIIVDADLVEDKAFQDWVDDVWERYQDMQTHGLSLQTIANNMSWRLKN